MDTLLKRVANDANNKSNSELALKKEEVLPALEVAKTHNYACLGGQAQFKFDDVTCELYWCNYEPEAKKENEKWEVFCQRSINEVEKQFSKLIKNTNFSEEGINEFEPLKRKLEQGTDLEYYLYFIIYFSNEDNYLANSQ